MQFMGVIMGASVAGIVTGTVGKIVAPYTTGWPVAIIGLTAFVIGGIVGYVLMSRVE